MNGDFSSTRWSAADCARLQRNRADGYEYDYLESGTYYRVRVRSDLPADVPWTAFDGEWLRHCL